MDPSSKHKSRALRTGRSNCHFNPDDLTLFGPEGDPLVVLASSNSSEMHDTTAFHEQVQQELYDDKNHKAALQAMAVTVMPAADMDRSVRMMRLVQVFVGMTLLGVAIFSVMTVFGLRDSAAFAKLEHQCGWGTRPHGTLCAPDEEVLFDWSRLEQDRGKGCQAPDLHEWTCQRYNADELNRERRLFEDYLGETAQLWANETIQQHPLLQLATRLCQTNPGTLVPRRVAMATQNLTCLELGRRAARDELEDVRIALVHDPRNVSAIVLAWITQKATQEEEEFLTHLPCTDDESEFWRGLQSPRALDVWNVHSNRAALFTPNRPLQASYAPCQTRDLLGTPDELYAPSVASCEERVLYDWMNVLHLELSRALQERRHERHLHRLFEQLQQRMARTIAVAPSRMISNETRTRLLDKTQSLALDLVLLPASVTEELISQVPQANDYTSLLQQHMQIELRKALEQHRPQLRHNLLEPAIYLDRSRNTLVVHPFMASTPLYPGDTAENVLARLGWRMAREMYWLLDPELGQPYDSRGVRHTEGWLYQPEELQLMGVHQSECRASRFAFCLVLRLLGEQDFVPSPLRNTTSEWAKQVFWSASTTLCHGTPTEDDMDSCMRSFAPYRASFDCQSTKRAQANFCSVDGTLWCQCLPYD